MSVESKRVIVTGAASGMGREIATVFAAQGAELVAIADVDADGLQATAEAVSAAGAKALPLAVDLRDEAQIERMVTDTIAEAGGLDSLINCAGVLDHVFTAPDRVDVENLDVDVWDAVMDINLKALWLATKFAGPHLRASDRGAAIVNFASVAGMHGSGMTAYSVSKAAVIQLTRVAAINLSPDVRVNAISPGSIRTPMSHAHLDAAPDAERHARAVSMFGTHLIPRFGETSEIAAAVAFLASDAASFITGVNLPVDGGTTAWRGYRQDIVVPDRQG